ncbi:nucleotidyl transferase AbiEii/AbiGii toxin family protein [Dermabacteraceae bacterium P13147]
MPNKNAPHTLRTQIARRRSLNARLSAEAVKRKVANPLIRKQYIFAVFLGRIFRHANPKWMLLGGNALLIRTGGGRFTQDIDLARSRDWDSVEELETELRDLAKQGSNEEFRFEITRVVDRNQPDRYGYGTRTAKANVDSYLGAKKFETFSIDITVQRHVNGPVDNLQLQPVIEDEALNNLPLIPTVPIENHLADKISALYERHHSGASTRYRDLADIVRIIKDIEFSASHLDKLLDHEAKRRQIARPQKLVSPAPGWESEYPKAAKNFAEFPAQFHSLSDSLNYAGYALNDVMSQKRTTGKWDPIRRVWN